MDDVKDFLDGSNTRDSGCDVIGTRDDHCPQHGPFVAQQIRLRPSNVPYWCPCPPCQAEWDKDNREEEKRLRQIEWSTRMCRTDGREWQEVPTLLKLCGDRIFFRDTALGRFLLGNSENTGTT
jgi:hypothetical protein